MDSNLIPAKLIELHSAINDKTGKLNLTPDLHIYPTDSNYMRIVLWREDAHGETQRFIGDDATSLFKEAFGYIDSLPSEAEQKLAEVQADLAELIDKCRDYNMDADLVNPLAAASKKLAENAITKESK